MINESRLVGTFLQLVAIDSPSGQEEAIGAELMHRLAALGGEVVRDERGNVIARWPQGTGDWLLLSAHMDTVGKDTGIAPQIRDGVITSDGTTILGSDDKSGIAVILETITALTEAGCQHPPLEVVITVSEEVGLLGSRWLDKGKLRAQRGYVFDAGGPIADLIVGAPSQESLDITVHGRKAHAGAEPELGINAIKVAAEAVAAMPLGRIDAETTANIGVIEGGVATNIVPDVVHMRGEARSHNPASLEAQVQAMHRALEEACRHHGARVSFERSRPYTGYYLTPDHPVVALASRALGNLGLTAGYKRTGGGSDANIFNEAGIACAVISTGMAAVHTPEEHIAVQDMVDSARLLYEIVALP